MVAWGRAAWAGSPSAAVDSNGHLRWKVFRSWLFVEWLGMGGTRLLEAGHRPGDSQHPDLCPASLWVTEVTTRGCTLLGSPALSVFHHNTERGVAGKAMCVGGGWQERAGCQLQW